MIERLEKRAELVVSRLNAIDGFHCVPPQGAFYVFPTIAYKGSDWDFVKELLKATGVVTVPGTGFGQKEGTKHIRLTLLPPEPVLTRAMDHIEDFMRKSR
jgi:alanine-synthesizing transaminase